MPDDQHSQTAAGGQSYTIEVPRTPPSMNSSMRQHRMGQYRAVKEWKQDLGVALMLAHVPRRGSFARCTGRIVFRDRRRRDVENFRPVLVKALGDILQEYGSIPDDTAAEFEFVDLRLEVGPSGPLTVIELELRP